MKKLIVAIVLVFACSAYAGEKPLSLQVFPYAGGWFADDYLSSSALYGGRIGFNFNRFLGLEAGYEFLPNEFTDGQGLTGDVDGNHIYGDITLSPFKSKKFVPYILVGGGDLMLDAEDVSDPADQWTVMWGLGLKYYFNEWLGVRAEARQINISDETALNLAATAGIQIRLGGRGEPKVVQAAPPVIDSDGDTIADDDDRCPDTPQGVKVNSKGCATDSDGDTVPDSIDQCPDTPKGEKVNAVGCPLDSDGDTVVDSADQCPDSPKGTAVDAKGCPEEAAEAPDTDGDTVPDTADRCPKTVAGAKVDADGCEIIFDRLMLKGIKFQTGKSIIIPSSYPILDNVAETLKAHPEIKVEIQGYTDSQGARASNMKLSLARAKAVHTYLVKKGIPAAQMTFQGYGPDSPIGDNATPEGRAENRRIEFKVIK